MVELFGLLKTFFLNLKSSFFSGKEEKDKVTVLAMKGKEEAVSIPDERDNPGNTEHQFNSSENKLLAEAEDGRVNLSFPTPSRELTEDILSALPPLMDHFPTVTYLSLLLRYGAVPIAELYKVHGHTIEGRKFVDRRALALTGFVLTFFCIAKLSGKALSELTAECLKNLLNASTPIEDSPENQNRLRALESRLVEVLRGDTFISTTVSGEFFEVSEAKATEFLLDWLQKVNKLVNEGKVSMNLDGFEYIPQEKKILLIDQYNALPPQPKVFIKDHCDRWYEKLVIINDLVGDAANLESVDYNPGQSFYSHRQYGVPTTSQPHEFGDRFLRRIRLGDVPDPQNPDNLPLARSFEQATENLHIDLITPKSSYEESSTTSTVEEYRRHEYEAKVANARQQLERAYNWRNNSSGMATSSRQPIGGYFSIVPDHSADRLPGADYLLFPSNQVSTNPSMEGTSSDTQLVSRRQQTSSSNNDLPFTSSSPLESFEQYRYVQWVGSGLCAFNLLTTSQIAWAILRKLNYTQDLVNKMTDRGFPKFLFFWVRDPNPGPVGEKSLSRSMVIVLVGNIIILYLLVKLIYLLP